MFFANSFAHIITKYSLLIISFVLVIIISSCTFTDQKKERISFAIGPYEIYEISDDGILFYASEKENQLHPNGSFGSFFQAQLSPDVFPELRKEMLDTNTFAFDSIYREPWPDEMLYCLMFQEGNKIRKVSIPVYELTQEQKKSLEIFFRLRDTANFKLKGTSRRFEIIDCVYAILEPPQRIKESH